MRTFALALMLVASSALAAGIPIDPANVVTFTDCASGGSAAQTIPEGDFLLTVADADVFLCFAASASTCASGGIKFPQGTVARITTPRGLRSLSCRSSASTADVYLVPSR